MKITIRFNDGYVYTFDADRATLADIGAALSDPHNTLTITAREGREHPVRAGNVVAVEVTDL